MLGFLVLTNIKPGKGGCHLLSFFFKLSGKVNTRFLVTDYKHVYAALRKIYFPVFTLDLHLLFLFFNF